MAQSIHRTAIIEKGAILGDNVSVGPYSYIGENVALGDDCNIHSHAVICGQTELAEGVTVHSHATIGDAPQILGFESNGTSKLYVGPRTVLRENVTLHTSSGADGHVTEVGADCYLMIGAHLGHDVRIGNKVVIANAVQIAGHVEVGDNVWFGGAAAVHQFCRIGRNAFIGGGAILVEDVIPFGSVIGNRAHLAGLNIVGLKRNGFTKSEMHEIRRTYKYLFFGDGQFSDRVESAAQAFADLPLATEIISFIRAGKKRAMCQPLRTM